MNTSRKREMVMAAGYALVSVVPALVLSYIAIGPRSDDLPRWEHISLFLLTLLIASLGLLVIWTGARSIEHLHRSMRSVAHGKLDRAKPMNGRLGSLYTELNSIMGRIEEQTAMIEESSRELERKVEEGTKQLIGAERLSAVGEMAAGIAHEMNNIMMPIIGYASILKAKVGDEELRGQAEIIEECATRGSKIIRRLLTFARQDRSTFSRLEVDETVRIIDKLMRPGLEQKGIQFSVDIQPAPPVRGNDSQLQQVLANLVINAQQAVKCPGGVIGIRSGVSGGKVTIAVKDNGEGMDEEMRRSVFQPFFTTKGPGSGTGLGLSISYGIIADHGGRIEVRSELGKGSEFTIYLPAMESERENSDYR